MRRTQGSKPYASTSVSVAVTQHRDITGLFAKYGVQKWNFATDKTDGIAMVRFEMSPGRWARVMLKMPVEKPDGRPRRGRPKADAADKAEMMVWRALYNWLKVQFEAIEYGVFTPQEAFLGWMEIPTREGGVTVAEALLPHLDDLPRLLGDGRD